MLISKKKTLNELHISGLPCAVHTSFRIKPVKMLSKAPNELGYKCTHIITYKALLEGTEQEHKLVILVHCDYKSFNVTNCCDFETGKLIRTAYVTWAWTWVTSLRLCLSSCAVLSMDWTRPGTHPISAPGSIVTGSCTWAPVRPQAPNTILYIDCKELIS